MVVPTAFPPAACHSLSLIPRLRLSEFPPQTHHNVQRPDSIAAHITKIHRNVQTSLVLPGGNPRSNLL